jgi:phage terminase large subunit GpA-like protein
MRVPGVSGAEIYDTEVTPYMLEPMRCLTSRQYSSVVFVGPQRTGKTLALFDAWLHYSIQYDPSDMMFLFTSQDLARDFSKKRFDRLIEYNEGIKSRLIRGHGDNVFDKKFIAGNIVNLAWPSIGQLRQRDIRFAAVTELDSMTDDLGGAGDIYQLLTKRTQTYMSSAKTLAEGAPSKPVNLESLQDWKAPSDHWPLPAEGLAKLYVQGTRHRLYWFCKHCGDPFQASFKYLKFDENGTAKQRAKTVIMVCPHCGGIHQQHEKYELNKKHKWYSDGELEGKPTEASRASFWMEGVAAGFQSWQEIVEKYIQAMETYDMTLQESDIKTVINSDIGLQYVPLSSGQDQITDFSDKKEDVEKGIVPDDVNYLITTIDQQAKRFVVQVHGYGKDGECWIIDRYNIAQSPSRVGEDGKPLSIQPDSYIEDWRAIEKVILKEYRTKTGALMRSHRVAVDTGGKDDATHNAYTFYKNYRQTSSNPEALLLIKGYGRGARYSLSEDVKKKSKVLLWILNVNLLKDEVRAGLDRRDHGPNYIHFPQWLGEWFFDELNSEKKNEKGEWVKKKAKSNNEAFDLLGYSRAINSMISNQLDWQNLPLWAKRAGDRQEQQAQNESYDMSFFESISKQMNS